MLSLEDAVIRNGHFELTADLTVQARRIVAVMGPSGSGKSTLISGIAGFLPLVRGRVTLNGVDVTQAAPGARPIAMLFQDGNLFPHLSVEENVSLGIRPDLRLSAGDRAHVVEALDRVGLKGLGDRKPAALSGGQQSRAALARVLVQSRPLVILDEPFAALGPALKSEMLDLVQTLVREGDATAMMVTHDPADARRIADDILLVAEGSAHSPQATAALLDNPPPSLKAYLG